MLEPLEPLARAATPIAGRLLEQIENDEVDAITAMLDRLPLLLKHLDEDILPLMGQLDRVGPDIHAILETVEDLRNALQGMPGISLLRRRGEKKQEEDTLEQEGVRSPANEPAIGHRITVSWGVEVAAGGVVPYVVGVAVSCASGMRSHAMG